MSALNRLIGDLVRYRWFIAIGVVNVVGMATEVFGI